MKTDEKKPSPEVIKTVIRVAIAILSAILGALTASNFETVQTFLSL